MSATTPPALSNPFLYLTQEQIRGIFGFGADSMRALVAMPDFPIVAKRINPKHFHRWMWKHRAAIGKLTP